MAKAKKGFGESPEWTQSAKDFILAFGECIAEGDPAKVEDFVESNLEKLNEDFLKALPKVFTQLTTGKYSSRQKQNAALFLTFGNFLRKTPLGNRALNLEISIFVHQLILKVLTREAFPKDWARTQNSLGAAYSIRICGDRADNLEQAIHYCENALQVLTREAFPEGWAMTQMNLGNAYSDRIRRDQANNLEQAIATYENALQVLTHEAFPEGWAMTQMNLGNAYNDRIRGDRADNFEQAIATYENALQVYTREAFPQDWAMTQMNLGTAYDDRIRGDRADNLEQAITTYENALQVYTREAFPQDWARTQNNLGSAYSDRIRGDRANNLEQAIHYCENALQVRTREAFPQDWARTQMNLGNAYSDRIRGDRADNFEQAIATYENALQVYTREAFPQDWALTQQNLANVYRESLQGDPLDNLTLAIQTHEKAAEVFTRSAYPHHWVSNQSDMAESFIKRATLTTGTQSNQDLTTAINLLTDALEIAPPGSPDYIDSHYRLGNALSRRYELTKDSADLDHALQAYKTALDAISPEHYDRNKIWQALPTTQSVLGSRLVRDGQWQDGLQLLLNSVSQLRNSEDRLPHASALYETAHAYEALSDWDNARSYYRDALRLYTHLENKSGMAKSLTGLGTTLGAQGYLEKSMATLQQARDLYEELQQPEKITEVDSLYHIAQQTLDGQELEVSA